jgi:hypothetical protein
MTAPQVFGTVSYPTAAGISAALAYYQPIGRRERLANQRNRL